MVFSFFYPFLGFLIDSVILFVSSSIKINVIWNAFPAYFTAFQGISLSYFGFNFLTLLYFFISYYKGFVLFLKFPSLIGGFCFSFLKANDKRYISFFISFLFFLLTFLFVFFIKKTFIYGLFWIISSLLLLFRNGVISLFESAFISVWLAHACGTIIYGFYFGFLTDAQYIALFPISVCERIILTIILYLFYMLRNYICCFFGTIKAIELKKN
jgi:hypothetical protein